MQKLTGATIWYGTEETCPDLRYLSGFVAVDPAILVAGRKRGVLIVSSMEVARARRAARSARLRIDACCPADLVRGKRLQGSGPAEWIKAAAKKISAGRLEVSSRFPVGIADALRRRGMRVEVKEISRLAARRRKDAGEIRRIAATQKAAVAAMKEAVKMVKAARAVRGGGLMLRGRRLTAGDIRRRIEEILLRHGCAATRTIVACGNQAADPHEMGHGALHAGRPIVIDIFPRDKESGYWGDLTRTVARKPVPARLAEMYDAVLAAQRAALEMVRAGATMRGIHRAVVKIFERRGWRTEIRGGRRAGFIHGVGHGVGLEIHEAPSIRDGPGRLRAGDIVTIEPGLYYPGLGGVRIEDTVLVTRHGYRMLAACPKRLQV